MTDEPRPPTAPSIVGNVTIRFRGGDYRWIDVKLFEFAGAPSDAHLLAALIAQPQFRDLYMGFPPGNDPPLHGPYHLHAVTPDRYQRLETAEATTVLDEFCALDGIATPESLAGDIQLVVRRRLAAATSLYRLSLPETDQHDFGWVLWEFRELVLIARETRELALVVMGID